MWWLVLVVDSKNLPGIAPTLLPCTPKGLILFYKNVVGPLLTSTLPICSRELYWKRSVKIQCPPWFLKFRIEQSNTRGILNFRAKGIKYFGSLKTKWKFPYNCPTVGQTEGILTPSVVWMYVTVKPKHVIETIRKQAVFIKVHNFTYLEFDNVFKF